jgi:tetratricopeptide (TPR) repeat protein
MFEAGDALYEGKRFEEAADAFRQSHSLVNSPNSRLMLARSLRELGRKAEAAVEYRGTIEDAQSSAGRYPEAKQAATAELDALDAEADSPPAAAQQQAPKTPPPTVAAPTAPLQELPPSKPANSPMRTYAWIATGVGAVGLGGFGVFAYLDRKTYRALEADCPDGQCRASADERIERGQTYQLCANVGLAVALTGAATATTLFLLSSPKNPEERSLAVAVSPGALSLKGRF